MKYSKIILPAVVLLLTACGNNNKQAVPSEEINAIPVTLVPVEIKEVVRPVYASGLLATDNEARLSFKTAGIIRKIYVREGDRISKGQLLAELDVTEVNALTA